MSETKPNSGETPRSGGGPGDTRAGSDVATKGSTPKPLEHPSKNEKSTSKPFEDYTIPIDPPDNQGGGW